MHTQMQTGVDWYIGRSARDRVSNIARVHEGSELSNVVERRKRVLRCGDDDGRGALHSSDCESIQRQYAAPSNDRGAVHSNTLKRDSFGFRRNTRRESLLWSRNRLKRTQQTVSRKRRRQRSIWNGGTNSIVHNCAQLCIGFRRL